MSKYVLSHHFWVPEPLLLSTAVHCQLSRWLDGRCRLAVVPVSPVIGRRRAGRALIGWCGHVTSRCVLIGCRRSRDVRAGS